MIGAPLGDTIAGRLGALAYGGVVGVRNALYDLVPAMSARGSLTVVSVGGVHAGGTGKTPLVGLIAQHFIDRGANVGVVSRGYRRVSRSPIVVSPRDAVDWRDVGDEPAMLRKQLPLLWLSIDSNRPRGIRALAAKTGANAVAVLDDGFQHRRARRDVDIVCLPPAWESSTLIPRGYLREPLAGIRRADMVCLIGGEGDLEALNRDAADIQDMVGHEQVYVLCRRLGPWVMSADGSETESVPCDSPAVTCAIARPERFLSALRERGLSAEGARVYPDHYAYRSEDVDELLAGGADSIVTTEKDAVRLASLKLANQPSICYLRLRLTFTGSDAEERFYRFLHGRTQSK